MTYEETERALRALAREVPMPAPTPFDANSEQIEALRLARAHLFATDEVYLCYALEAVVDAGAVEQSAVQPLYALISERLPGGSTIYSWSLCHHWSYHRRATELITKHPVSADWITLRRAFKNELRITWTDQLLEEFS